MPSSRTPWEGSDAVSTGHRGRLAGRRARLLGTDVDLTHSGCSPTVTMEAMPMNGRVTHTMAVRADFRKLVKLEPRLKVLYDRACAERIAARLTRVRPVLHTCALWAEAFKPALDRLVGPLAEQNLPELRSTAAATLASSMVAAALPPDCRACGLSRASR